MGKNIDDMSQSDSNYDSPAGKLPMIKKMDSTSSSQTTPGQLHLEFVNRAPYQASDLAIQGTPDPPD
jgi:hypothetical protein